ncbi:MAG: DUF5334 family protein [Syntrophaceae bacterium]
MNSKRDIFLIIYLSALLLLLPTLLHAWTGYDYESENYIEFDKDAPVVQGKDFDIYDYSDETRHTVYVISIVNTGNEVVIEVYDYDEGEYRTFYMDKDTSDHQTNVEYT